MLKVKKYQLPKRLPQLALVSFIAACSETPKEELVAFANGFSSRVGDDPVILPFEAAELSETESGFTATPSGTGSPLTVTIGGNKTATLSFNNTSSNSENKANIYQLRSTAAQYDLVVSSLTFDSKKGGIFIYWDMAGIQNENSPHLEIQGATADDQIGKHASEFLKLGGEVNSYDMVIRAQNVYKGAPAVGILAGKVGAYYILWDISTYKSDISMTLILGNTIQKTQQKAPTNDTIAGSLAIFGPREKDLIGEHDAQFMKIDNDNDYDMVIRSEWVWGNDDGNKRNAGAIYILWDIPKYKADGDVILNLDHQTRNNFSNGLLLIYGAKALDFIGIHASEFLQIDSDKKPDLIIRSHTVDKDGNRSATDAGAIYILWDVGGYTGGNAIITLDDNATGVKAESGLLAIKGATLSDQIGTFAPDFLQIGGKDGYDMVIRSEHVDKSAAAADTDTGALYVLWDVADYAAGADKNKSIDFATPADATSGLLTIYGREGGANLGSDDNNILYGDDGELTNIDKGQAGDSGKNDIAFRDKDYTYILFGDKIAEVNGDKVKSKSIDLAVVQTLFGDNGVGYFKYDFKGSDTDISDGDMATTDTKANATGYRFATGTGSTANMYTTLAEVQTAYSNATLSDADADLGVWDIA